MKKVPSVDLIRTIAEMRSYAEALHKRKKNICLVPTMGGLHEGHLSLVKAAKRLKKRCDVLVVSIFVNPKQFAPHEDFKKYPRDLEGDLDKLAKLDVDAVFAPSAEEIFPSGYKTFIDVEELSRRLCGRSRPGHFRGVATVVLKMMNIIRPRVAIFGEKDYQQMLIIRKMVKDLNLQVDIEQRPVIREDDGLALSTRNKYLSEEQRTAALCLTRALQVAERLIISGERNSSIIISNLRELIRSQPGTDIDYIAVVHPETLADLEAVEARSLIALAVRFGTTRLIDNLLVDLVSLDKRERERKAAESKARPSQAPAKKPAAKRSVKKKPAAKKKAVAKKKTVRKKPAAGKSTRKKAAAKKPAKKKGAARKKPSRAAAKKGGRRR